MARALAQPDPALLDRIVEVLEHEPRIAGEPGRYRAACSCGKWRTSGHSTATQALTLHTHHAKPVVASQSQCRGELGRHLAQETP